MHVHDLNKGALVRFGPDGAVLPQVAFPFPPIRVGEAIVHVLADGLAVLDRARYSGSDERPVRLLHIAGADTTVLFSRVLPLSKTTHYPSCGMNLTLPTLFAPQVRWTRRGSRIAIATGAASVVELYEGGRLVRSVRRPIEPRQITAAGALRELREQAVGGPLAPCNISAADIARRGGCRAARHREVGQAMRVISRTFAAVVACTAFIACGADAQRPAGTPVVVRDSAGIRIVESAAPLWRPGEEWRLADTPSVHIKAMGADPDAVLLNPASVYRDAAGRYIVADGGSSGHNQVLVFDSAGRFLGDYGRAGGGPCEFRYLSWAAPYRGDSIAAYDDADHTIAIFDRDGRCGREVRLPTWRPALGPLGHNFTRGADAVYPDGSFLAYPLGYLDVSSGEGPVWYRHALLRVAPDGAAWDSLGLFGIVEVYWSGKEQRERPFLRVAVRALHGEDLYYGEAERFEILRYDGRGRLRAIIRRAYEREPITAEDREAYRRRQLERARGNREGGAAAVERMLRDAAWPDHKPAYWTIIVDAGGNLWVAEGAAPTLTGASAVHWSVFDPDGAWLGQVEVPGQLKLESIGEDYAIGIWRYEDDTKDVRVYELIKPARRE